MAVEKEEEATEETLVPGSSADSRRCAVFRKLADNMNSTIVSVVEFLRRLPGEMFQRRFVTEQSRLSVFVYMFVFTNHFNNVSKYLSSMLLATLNDEGVCYDKHVTLGLRA